MAVKDISDAQVCQACAAFHAGDRDTQNSLSILMAMTGQPSKVCFRAMERAERRGLIECGVSLQTAWPSKTGWQLAHEATTGGNNERRGEQ